MHGITERRTVASFAVSAIFRLLFRLFFEIFSEVKAGILDIVSLRSRKDSLSIRFLVPFDFSVRDC